MSINSRVLSLALAGSISLITSFVFQALSYYPKESFWAGLFISFGISFVLVFGVMEFLFFRELKKLYAVFKKISKENISGDDEANHYVSLNKIYKEMNDYAYNKESEIEELKKNATFRRQFLADVSHELKTPIFAAQGFVHTLLDGAVEDDKIRINFLKKAAKNLDGLDILVQDLLTVSHMESGDITMLKENFDICEVIYDIFDEFEERVLDKELKLFASSKRYEEVIVYADSRRIYQVLVNLISNAIKYTERKGFIYVDIDDGEENVTINIKDNGLGIPTQDIDRIFDRFYRVDKSRSKENGGTGLGLSIVKHIVEAHGSSINVKSTMGKGSEFSFKLKAKQ